MKDDEVLATYDDAYAAGYDDTFLHAPWTKESLAFQLRLLERYLADADNWLDVACGTGYVLSRFPHVQRAGLDISPSMLARARQRNPGVEFVERNYRDPFPPWNDQWDVVTCMCWAYCFSETMAGIEQLIARLADWVSPAGTCLLPLANPQKFDRENIRIPYIDARVVGRCMITGVTWSWVQQDGKRHDNMLSPLPHHMAALFRLYFDQVEIVEGPLDLIGEGWRIQDVLVAQRKKRERPRGALFKALDGERAGQLEWFFSTGPGALAGLDYPSTDLRRIRVSVVRTSETADPAAVRAEKVGYRVEAGRCYQLAFHARSDSPRSVMVGVSTGVSPWDNLGCYGEVSTADKWQEFQLEFRATASCDRSRVHFDLGASTGAIELQDLRLTAAS